MTRKGFADCFADQARSLPGTGFSWDLQEGASANSGGFRGSGGRSRRPSRAGSALQNQAPRVDVLFLERAGFAPEEDLDLALRKDAGIDPGVLAWLLAQFPTEPLPTMLQPLSRAELEAYRDDLANRLRRMALDP